MFTDFISLESLSTADIIEVLDLADDLRSLHAQRKPYHPLKGQTIAMVFEKPSLRTRVTFETGMYQLGGLAVTVGADSGKLGERESVPDVARNLERWVDGVVARTFSHPAVEELAKCAQIPVINALTDRSHPCQVLADAQALRQHLGHFEGLKVVFVGDGNNVAASWFEFAARIPIEFTLACPPSHMPEPAVVAFAEKHTPGSVRIVHDPREAARGADVIYTDVWTSMGQESEQIEREKLFAPFQVNAALMKLAKPTAVFMHCLPAKRGKEVTDEVMDSDQSVVFDQAENRLHTQKAILTTLLKRDRDGLTRKARERQKAELSPR
jgi:ornithine carbamoyltransferase